MDHLPANLLLQVTLFIKPEVSTVLVILLVLLLFLSACIAGAEIAFFSLTHKDLNSIRTRQQPAYKRIVNLLQDPKNLLACMLLANAFSNIGIIVLGNFVADGYLSNLPVFAGMHPYIQTGIVLAGKIIIVSLLILTVEILPKVLASQNNIRFAKAVSGLIEGVYLALRRLASWLVGYSDAIERRFGQRNVSASLEELDQAIDMMPEEEVSIEEKSIIKSVRKFRNITVRQVMKARLDVNGIDATTSFGDLRKKVEELHYSRLPVYNETLDDIKGIVHTKDLLPHLHEAADYTWLPLIRPPYFVHEQKQIEDLLKEFQHKRIHFAVVVDEFGGTSGIVTLEDILEEVIGDIKDEFDEEESANKQLDEKTWLFEGKTMLNDVCRMMGIRSDTFDELKGDSDSLAGLILEVAGEIPKLNQVIEVGDYAFTIAELDKNRIQRVKVTAV